MKMKAWIALDVNLAWNVPHFEVAVIILIKLASDVHGYWKLWKTVNSQINELFMLEVSWDYCTVRVQQQ